MKMGIIKSIMAISALSMGTASPVQAQTWTNAGGYPLLLGEPVTLSGSLDISYFGWMGRRTCIVSIDGTFIGGVIRLTNTTPGFWSNCDPDDVGYVSLPIDVEPVLAGGRRAMAQFVSIDTPVGPCMAPIIFFSWNDAPVSEAVLMSNVTAAPCVLHAGSRLRVTGSMAGDVSIN